MKASQALKQIISIGTCNKTKESAQSSFPLVDYALGTFCFFMFVALGPFAAIPAFFATFSLPRIIEESKNNN
ncbi:hypothetical protein [Thermodesulfatator atlanticus]|uniref:hypothetical protein n=1 Tax=Thermodesulfatator atlanticus TaxID=501497 RepID=UPI0003B62E9B|nr:hypothetical protein [Thermodesulfatator atlanticus]